MENPENRESKILYNKGVEFNKAGQYKLAISNFLRSLELDNTFIEAHFDLGAAYINNKDYDLAIESFNQVLRLSENETSAFSNIALAYLRKNDLAKSIEYYQKVLEFEPDDPDTFMELAYAYVKNSQFDEAIELYKKAMKFGTHLLKAKEGLNTALNMKNCPEPVIEEKEPEVDADDQEQAVILTESPDHYFELAINFVKEQNFDSAIENLRNCLKINPKYTKATMLLDKIFQLKQQKASGGTQPAPNTAFNELFNAAASFLQQKNYDMALVKFNQCLQIDPNNQQTKEIIKKILAHKGLM